MDLRSALSTFLADYPHAAESSLAGNPVAVSIRKDFPHAVNGYLPDLSRYKVKGSVGQGNWSKTPWVAIFDRLITDTAQAGYFVVYLAREDFEGVYLSLNQGVTSVRRQYRSGAKHALRARAEQFRAKLGNLPVGISRDRISLVPLKKSSLSAYYEAGSICSIYYERLALPPEEKLAADLALFIRLYAHLAASESQLFKRADAEDDELILSEENLQILRQHKRIERNRNLAKRAKAAHGYVCKACGFDFEQFYGEVGKSYIEAHHLTPLSGLKGSRLKLSPRSDFTVLCSNCHRMIHRSGADVGNINAFRETHIGSRRNACTSSERSDNGLDVVNVTVA